MKILLACGAGLSTSVLMKRVAKYAESKGIELVIDATSANEAPDKCAAYDCVLIGPQVSYQLDALKKSCSVPVASIDPLDYSLGNAENVLKLAYTITGI